MYLPCNIGDTLKLKNYMFFIWNSNLTSHSVVLFVNSGHPRREGLGHRRLEPPRGCGPEKAGWALRWNRQIGGEWPEGQERDGRDHRHHRWGSALGGGKARP